MVLAGVAVAHFSADDSADLSSRWELGRSKCSLVTYSEGNVCNTTSTNY
jgi:hypothetical protein